MISKKRYNNSRNNFILSYWFYDGFSSKERDIMCRNVQVLLPIKSRLLIGKLELLILFKLSS